MEVVVVLGEEGRNVGSTVAAPHRQCNHFGMSETSCRSAVGYTETQQDGLNANQNVNFN